MQRTTAGNYTPLHAGTYGGNDKVVRLLLDAGAEVNVHTTEGQSPVLVLTSLLRRDALHNAMAYSSREIIEMLLDAAPMRTRQHIMAKPLSIGQHATRSNARSSSCSGCEL
jgi:ankyrin repeat protein